MLAIVKEGDDAVTETEDSSSEIEFMPGPLLPRETT
jgi:hypothetical protein